MEVTINGKRHQVTMADDTPLLWVIRDELGMTGTKYGCGIAQCGACTVLIDAISDDAVGRRVVEAWVANQVPQCGYCQSGQVMAATALIKQTPKPSEQDIAAAMVNLCRCGTYNAIAAAVRQVAQG
jgi:isoquinoline 1-oxidoreductase alpha subunit